MALPMDIDARKYCRAGRQRLEEAQLILLKLSRPAAAVCLAGYAVECVLKVLVLTRTPPGRRPALLPRLKRDFGHDLDALKRELLRQRLTLSSEAVDDIMFLSTWSPELRYEPGPGDPAEARQFLKAAERVVHWAEGRM